jgi:tRNA nucleotidyltransferase (CCA-adding enzyme)
VDLGRRDFTVNAMALKLGPDGAIGLLDPFGGEKDLRERVLRVLHEKSFSDDPTRLFRAARYAARLSLRPDGRTLALVEEASAGRFAGLLSRERIRQELLRTLEEADPGPAFALLRAWGLSSELHPAFVWPSEAGRFAEPLVRLGLCALKMGEAGSDFIFSLRLARGEARPLLAAVRESRSELSPAKPLPELALRVLRAGLPQAPPAAFDPILIGGEDLKRQGLKPGPDFSRILDAAARAQKKGEFADRGAALDWLRREAGGRM